MHLIILILRHDDGDEGDDDDDDDDDKVLIKERAFVYLSPSSAHALP